jgi:hypothetical protein
LCPFLQHSDAVEVVEVFLSACEIESSLSLVVSDAGIGSEFQQRFDASGRATSGCAVESSKAMLVFGVSVGSGSQQLLGAVEMALSSCAMESSLSLAVLDVDVYSWRLQ